MALRRGGSAWLAGPTTPLGSQEKLRPGRLHFKLAAGELLVVYGTSGLATMDESLFAKIDERIATTLRKHRDLPIDELATLAGESISRVARQRGTSDATVSESSDSFNRFTRSGAVAGRHPPARQLSGNQRSSPSTLAASQCRSIDLRAAPGWC